jgi:hypothetical protein
MIFHIKLAILFIFLSVILGCANKSTNLNLREEVPFPKIIAKGQPALYNAEINFNVIGAMIDPTAEIISVDLPNSKEYTIDIIDAKGMNSCWEANNRQGYQFTLNNNQCTLIFRLSSEHTGNINNTIKVYTKLENLDVPISHQLFDIPIKSAIVEPNAAGLFQIDIAPISIGVDIETKITIINSNDAPINNLRIEVIDWLKSYLHNASSQSIYELGPNQRFTFTFNLKQDEDTLKMLKQYQKAFNDNSSAGVIKVEAANIKKVYRPNINLVLEPAILSDVTIDINNQVITSAIKFTNQSDAVLKITKVDTSEIPEEISVFADVCLAQQVIAPNETCSIEVTNEGVTEPGKYPIWVHYRDGQNNNYILRTFILIKRK